MPKAIRLLAPALIAATASVHAGHIYWTDRGSTKAMRRMGLDGSSPTALIPLTSGADPRGVAIDPAAGSLYYAATTQIIRTALDGSGATVFVTGRTTVRDLHLDAAGGFLYWCDQDGDALGRASLATGAVDGAFARPAPAAYYLVLGPAARLYWGDSNSTVHRSELGSTASTPVLTGLSNVRGVRATATHLYWCEKDAKTVKRAAFTAEGNVNAASTQILYSGLNAPHGLALDPGAGKLYWVDSGTNGSTGFGRSGVNRGDLDGSTPAEALIGPSNPANNFTGQPWDLTLDTRVSTYAEWRARFFRLDAATTTTDPLADPDNDGLSNFVEYVSGTSPTTPASRPETSISLVQIDVNTHAAFTYVRQPGLTDATARVETSADATTWLDGLAAAPPTTTTVRDVTPLEDGRERVTVVTTDPLLLGQPVFMRLRAAIVLTPPR